MSRMRTAGCAAFVGLMFAGCGSGGWSDADRSAFLSDCLTNVRLEDDQLRSTICECWQSRSQSKYSYAEVNSGNQTIQADFVDIGKACSAEQNVRAHLPGES